ncbi:cellulase family glycosylhydrolase [Burkholderia stagnalis]|uniref:cellulase family glycosylhydrolase n=1 Tax=Burkholderia stagnalis TaxID=1503054 RepID=UPI000F5BB538|nr:cellulase family glycosylhydrolase [Burkholderia stagnalis]RQP98872.1 glycoside hydrolase [Burkholderia stagnalis]RQY64924.1 glycoside hydrolase [Burkholderia stagnalis]
MSGGDTDYGASQNPSSPYGASGSTDGSYAQSVPTGGPYGDSSTASASGGYAPYSNPQSAPVSSSNPSASRQIFGNGVNLQPSYQANGNVDLGWDLLKPISSVKTVRLEIEDFSVDAAVRWISEASKRGYTVIATFHSYDAINNKSASDDPKHMQLAIQFWNSNYKKLSAAGPFTINIMNEWGHKSIDAKTYAAQYNAAVSAIRSYYDGPLIIDLPGSGQLAKVAADAVSGAGGISPIQDRNVILSMHVYPKTWNGKGPLTLADMDLLVATGRPCMIGEFGESNETPDTDWRAIVAYAKSLYWPVLAWCWDGDGGIMNIMQPEFQPFVAGKTNPYYRINSEYANIVLPFLS